ncbi:MAG: IS30 family transposase [Gammaproteobacteria bacterium]|nr:IS30 family transposase [Gammaproteobacteria bacterium]NIT05472.1 IS30 family transposase [Gammaproteobacteria bacterium]
MRTYTQLTQEQRYQIYALKKMGHNQTEIANCIGVDKSTISRELKRNQGQRGYRPKQAHNLAMSRRKQGQRRIQARTWAIIDEKLRLDWSPEQISGWLLKHHQIQVSHEWIYQYLLSDKQAGGDLYKHLRCQKKRRKRYGSRDRRGKLPNRRSIEERPEIVDQRQRIGDWEVDTIVGKGHHQAIVTLTERKSRLALLRKVDRRTAELVGDAVIDLLQPLADRLHTITGDNGKEFAEHERIAQDLGVDFFFAHPYAAWERGANENMNGLVRQYIPKNRELSSVTNDELEQIMLKLNHRPRKCLDFMSPFEVFFEHPVALPS